MGGSENVDQLALRNTDKEANMSAVLLHCRVTIVNENCYTFQKARKM